MRQNKTIVNQNRLLLLFHQQDTYQLSVSMCFYYSYHIQNIGKIMLTRELISQSKFKISTHYQSNLLHCVLQFTQPIWMGHMSIFWCRRKTSTVSKLKRRFKLDKSHQMPDPRCQNVKISKLTLVSFSLVWEISISFSLEI